MLLLNSTIMLLYILKQRACSTNYNCVLDLPLDQTVMVVYDGSTDDLVTLVLDR